MDNRLDLQDRVAVITGAARGIGDILDDLGEQTAAGLGASASYVHCDISSLDEVRAMIDHAVASAVCWRAERRNAESGA